MQKYFFEYNQNSIFDERTFHEKAPSDIVPTTIEKQVLL